MTTNDPFRVFPKATEQERQQLRASIEAVGLRNPLVIDEHRNVIDGHERRDICDDLEAFKREKREDRRLLFPISLVPFKDVEDWKLIDSRTGTDLAEEIRQYFIPDFTNWKDHDAFEATYQRLMKDFKPTPDDK